MSKPASRLSIIPEHGAGLSREKRRLRHKEWHERTLRSLLEGTKLEPDLAVLTIEWVVDAFGSDDKLSALMGQKLKSAREGKPSGGRIKWDYAKNYQLLAHYHLQKIWFGRNKALELIADLEGLQGDNRAKKVAERITTARKVISPTDQMRIARLKPRNSPR